MAGPPWLLFIRKRRPEHTWSACSTNKAQNTEDTYFQKFSTNRRHTVYKWEERHAEVSKIQCKSCDGEKLMGTTRRKNEDLKSQGESAFGSWEGRLPREGPLEQAGLSDQAHWRTVQSRPQDGSRTPPPVPLFADPWG